MTTWKGKYGPLMIAEIGGNHEGDFEYAKKLTDLALESDSDIIKFQIYSGDTLVSKVESASRNEHFKKFSLTPEQYLELARRVEAGGKMFMASVWSVELLETFDNHTPIYKIGSGDLTAYPLLREFALRGKPMVVSTGLSSAEEVEHAVSYIRSVNKVYNDSEFLSILQCTSMYPIPASDANLSVMTALRSRLNTSVGYSDHTEGARALEIAYAMGAEVLEFHFTDEREGKSFRDHKVSLTVGEVKELQQRFIEITEYRGSEYKTPLPVEGDHVTSFRRAVYPQIDIAMGETLTAQHLTILRPNHGIDARDFDQVVGKTLRVPVVAHQRLDWDMFEEDK